jgi:hypothetical protein
MRDTRLPYQPKPVKEVTFLNIDFCQKWISYGFDIVTMLANSHLHHPMSALPKLFRKKKPCEKKLERLNRIIDCPVTNAAALVCVSWMWMAHSPSASYLGKEFLSVCSEYHCGCVFLQDDDVMKECSELLQQDFESQ